ncbi:hypothetical protein [Modestobacter altitudinis]|uniref:hypothetical protein n=1 Tax=Modestobacter altitudinis TaxID=2213158 RepID=UPI00110CC4AB|nr:hypothetical protein [Modestobacter altitudinis]
MTSSLQRRSPRAAPAASRRGSTRAPTAPPRPLQAPFAAVFGLLVAVEDGYLGWLLWDADPGWGWYLLAPLVLAAGALTGAVLVLRGRALTRWTSGSAVLVVFSVLPLLGLLGLAGFFAVLGGGEAVWWALLLLVGPIGALSLGSRRPVRAWTRPGRRRQVVTGARRAR